MRVEEGGMLESSQFKELIRLGGTTATFLS